MAQRYYQRYECESLKAQNQSLKLRIQKLQQIQAYVEALLSKNQQLQQLSISKDNEIFQLHDNIHLMKKQIKDLLQGHDLEIQNIDYQHKKLTAKLTDQIDVYSTRIKQFGKLIERLKLENRQAQINHQEQVFKLERDITILHEQIRSEVCKQTALQQIIRQLQTKIQYQKQRYIDLEEELNKAEDKIKLLDGSLAQCQQQINQSKEQFKNICNELNKAKDQIKSLNDEMSRKKEDIIQLNEKFVFLDQFSAKQVSRLNYLIEQLKKQRIGLESNLRRQEDCNEKRLQQVNKLMQKLQASQVKLAQQSETRRKIDKQNTSLRENISYLNKQLEQALLLNKKLIEQNNLYHQNYQELSVTLNKKLEEGSQLQIQNQRFKRILENPKQFTLSHEKKIEEMKMMFLKQKQNMGALHYADKQKMKDLFQFTMRQTQILFKQKLKIFEDELYSRLAH